MNIINNLELQIMSGKNYSFNLINSKANSDRLTQKKEIMFLSLIKSVSLKKDKKISDKMTENSKENSDILRHKIEIISTSNIKFTSSKKDKNDSKENHEISDKIIELVEDVDLESKSNQNTEFLKNSIKHTRKVQMQYINPLFEEKVMDYSKLEYGKIAQPLAINWTYSDYTMNESNDSDDLLSFDAEETISIEDVDKVIAEKAFSDKLGINTTTVSSSTKDMYKYFALFNPALVRIKYELVFA